VIIVRGVDLAAWEHLFKDRAKECWEGDAAPEAIVEEVSNDRIFGEGACEQSTCLSALVAAQSPDVDVHGVIPRRDRRNSSRPPNGSPLSCGRAQCYHATYRARALAQLKPAAVSFSGLLGGVSREPQSLRFTP
jgi:hypothetical protein